MIQQFLSTLTDVMLPLGSSLLAAGLIIKHNAAVKMEVIQAIADLRKKVGEQERTLDGMVANQNQLASATQVDEALRNQQSKTMDALLLAGQAFVEQRRMASDGARAQSSGVDRDR